MRWPFRSTARAVGNSGPACSGRSHDCRIFSQVSAVCRWSFSFKAGPFNFKVEPLNFKIQPFNFKDQSQFPEKKLLNFKIEGSKFMLADEKIMFGEQKLMFGGQKLMPEKRKFISLRLSIIPERLAQVALASLPPLFLRL